MGGKALGTVRFTRHLSRAGSYQVNAAFARHRSYAGAEPGVPRDVTGTVLRA
jgi:hypothetical protein